MSSIDDQKDGEDNLYGQAGSVDQPKRGDGRLLIPGQRLTRQVSIESLFSGSEISELSSRSIGNGAVRPAGSTRRFSDVSEPSVASPRVSTWRAALNRFWIINYGAFLVLCSQMFGAMMNVCTRTLETPGAHGEPMHPFQILFARQFITASITTSYALYTQSIPDFPLGPPGKVRILLVSRGLFGFLGVFGLYYSLLYLPISEATVLTFLSPIGSCIAFSLLIPGESFGRQQMLAGCVSLVGVLFIARPDSFFHNQDDTTSRMATTNTTGVSNSTMGANGSGVVPGPTPAQHLQAVGVALIGVVGAIGALTSIRAIGQRAHALLSVNYFSVWCTFVSLVALTVIPSVKFRLPANALEWGLLSILGFAGFTMQLLLTKGMAYGSQSTATRVLEPQNLNDIEMNTQTPGRERRAPTSLNSSSLSSHSAIGKGHANVKSSGAKATSMLYTQMLFALASDKIVFGVTLGVWSWIGSGFILAGAIWVATDNGSKTPKLALDLPEPRTQQAGASWKQDGNPVEEVGLLSDIDGTGSSSIPDVDEVHSSAHAQTRGRVI